MKKRVMALTLSLSLVAGLLRASLPIPPPWSLRLPPLLWRI